LTKNAIDAEDFRSAILRAVDFVSKTIGEISFEDNSDDDSLENYLTFVLTNGSAMAGFQGGKTLYYSTYKTRCKERKSCSSFAPECEAPTQSGFVNHLIFS